MKGSTISISILLLCVVWGISHGQECSRSKKLQFESCTSTSDCYSTGADFFSGATCLGRDTKDQLAECPTKGVDTCACVPRGAIRFCTSDSECPDETYCGTSPRNGASLCVGCLSYDDDKIGFKPLENNPSRCKATVDAQLHPPCGRALDFCSDTLPCKQPYSCLYRGTKEIFKCGSGTIPCQCYVPTLGNGNGKVVKAAIQECSTNADCDDREVCALQTFDSKKACVSCDYATKNPFYTASTSALAKCKQMKVSRSAPKYYQPSSNGRTLDVCVSDDQCTGSRKCVQFKNFSMGETNILKTKKCEGESNLCFCKRAKLTPCTASKQCQIGESCATTDIIGVSKKCVSNSFIASLSAENYELVGGFHPNPSTVNRLTGQKCKFDWQCGGSRRCTHITENWGGCAGRKSCLCQPLEATECVTDSACGNGERCMRYTDGKEDSFCGHPELVSRFPEIEFVRSTQKQGSDSATVDAGTGLTGDPCLTAKDCKSGRFCRHINEQKGFCGSRKFCKCVVKEPKKNQCRSVANCIDGEVCVDIKDSVPSQAACMSKSAFEADKTNLLKLVNIKTTNRKKVARFARSARSAEVDQSGPKLSFNDLIEMKKKASEQLPEQTRFTIRENEQEAVF